MAAPKSYGSAPNNDPLWHDSIVTTDAAKISRKFWRTLEAIHTIVYFVPGAKATYKEIGLRGYWSGYFASRSAALGEPSAELVTATFFSFAPRMVARTIPQVWALADRKDILAARESIATRALETIIGVGQVAAAADVLLDATRTLSYAGRPLAAAHRALPEPQSPIGRLWHAATVLREYRGDGHIAVLTTAGITPVEANIVQVCIGKAGADQQELRGWDNDAWAAGHASLVARGWLSADGTLTDLGRNERECIEVSTDNASDAAIAHLIGTPTADLLLGWARSIGASVPTPFPGATRA